MSIFEYTWLDDAEPYPDKAAEHTMAHLKICLAEDDDVATYLYDRYKKELANDITVPLVRVAEWLVGNWFHIWHEVGTTHGESRLGFASRHDLSYAGNGFVLPRIIFGPLGEDEIGVKVQPWKYRHAAVEFLCDGEYTMSRIALEKAFGSLIEDVIKRLRQQETSYEFLETEWQVIQSLDQEEREFCQAAAMLGLDPFNLDPETAGHIADIWNGSDPLIRNDMMLCADVDSLDEVCGWVKDSIEFANESASKSGADWSAVRNEVRNHSQDQFKLPWTHGYNDARAVREVLGKRMDHFPIEESGVHAIWSEEKESPSPRIEGCVADDSPSCIVVHKYGVGKRFILARALGDYIGREQFDGPVILNRLNTPRQARSRAFAAELLAPSEWLRDKVGNVQYVDSDIVDELAGKLEVSSLLVAHQLENHGIAEVYSRSSW